MANQYPNLTAPLLLRGHLLKTRFVYPVAQPHFIQASENYPAGPIMSYYENRARGKGAALILLHDLTDQTQRDMPLDCGHFSMYDIDDKGAQNGFSHFLSVMHMHGTFVTPEINMGRRMHLSCNRPEWGAKPNFGMPFGSHGDGDLIDRNGNPVPMSLDIAKTTQQGFDTPLAYDKGSKSAVKHDESPFGRQIYITREIMDEYIQTVITHAKKWRELGADGGYLDLSHNFPIGQFLRASFNLRTDEYGGSLENRMRFPLEVIRKVREAMGEDWMLILNSPVVCRRQGDDGMTLDELVVFLKEVEPYADMLQLRLPPPDHDKEDVWTGADDSAYLKSQGVKIPIAVSTPYKQLQKMENIIAQGKVDLVAPGHMFICNDNLGMLIQQGRGEDAAPCIECHCCRGTSSTGDWVSQCTINPKMGIEYRVPFIERPVTRRKRVAVIGGGPGGMYCAMELKDRGHEPVIFEKTDELGGQIKMANYAEFKWELLRYLNYLKDQVAKRGIEVRYNTTATPESVEAEAFDAVVVAVGARTRLPKIEGVEAARWDPVSIYGHEAEVGHKVVVIGGASSASEAAIYLSQCGHDVVQLCRRECIAYDLNPIRSIPYMNILANRAGVLTHHSVRTTRVEEGRVTFVDKNGNEHTVECDDIVAAGGMEPNAKLAASFSNSAAEFYMIGDCTEAGTMRHAIKDAYCIANQI